MSLKILQEKLGSYLTEAKMPPDVKKIFPKDAGSTNTELHRSSSGDVWTYSDKIPLTKFKHGSAPSPQKTFDLLSGTLRNMGFKEVPGSKKEMRYATMSPAPHSLHKLSASFKNDETGKTVDVRIELVNDNNKERTNVLEIGVY